MPPRPLPPIMGWARPLDQGEDAARRWHAVVGLRSSVETACRGRWPATERREFVEGRDRDVDHSGRRLDKCGACDLRAREERTEDGLAELAEAPVSMSGVVQFDLTDIDLNDEDTTP